MKPRIFPTFCLLVCLLTACGPAPQSFEPALLPEENHSPLPTAAPTAEAAPSEPAPVEIPSAALSARRALAELLGIQPEQIEIRQAEPVNWPDGCLGLAGPDEMCTMAIVPGYRVVLVFESVEYIYRADAGGTVLRRELGISSEMLQTEPRFLAAWQNDECTEQALLLPEGLSFGACGGSHVLLAWEDGAIPSAMADFLARFSPFRAQTPAGMVIFSGAGTETASLAEQRAVAEWLKIRFLAAQSGRPQADWGLALEYTRQGGFAGFCDEMKVYLDGAVLLSSCKNVDVDFRLDAEQLEQLYTWYDRLAKLDYSYTDPAVADAMSTTLLMPAQGGQAADQAAVNEILAFCAALIQQARSTP